MYMYVFEACFNLRLIDILIEYYISLKKRDLTQHNLPKFSYTNFYFTTQPINKS